MLAKDDLSRLLRYTVWANHRVMRVAATLGVEEFKRDLGGSHGGVRGTLAHMMWAELVWLERWKGLPSPPRLDEGQFADIVALRDRWTIVEEHRQSWFDALGADGPGTTIRYKTMDGAGPFESSLADLVQHAANHSSYHRGQVTNFLRQLGARTVASDMVVWDRDEQARALRDAGPR
jgi:uncharacterized damage-inducible protein DinB